MYYCENSSETVMYLTDIVTKNGDTFDSLTLTAQVKQGTEILQIYSDSGIMSLSVQLEMDNKLWYIQPRHITKHRTAFVNECDDQQYTSIDRLRAQEDYDLWHYRLGHTREGSTWEISKITT